MKLTKSKLKEMIKEELLEVKKRDYKAEYKKFQSSTKSKKYRAELNKYNRQKGTYGNGDGKDASHKGGKIVGFEKESVNRGRAEKSRLKKEGKLTEAGSMGGAIDMSGMNDSYVAPKRDTKGGDMKAFLQKYSSKEAKAIIDGELKSWASQLRKFEGKVVKDWMSAAKSGQIDFFDIIRGLKTGDVSRAHPYETQFLVSLLTKDKIVDRFRSYFKGKKGKKGRTK
jgi:hypothetical protein